MRNPNDEALSKILGDMDDLDSKDMFGGGQDASSGVDITISIAPKGGESSPDGLPADHDASMCGGGCAMHKGGMVKPTNDRNFPLP